MKLLFFAAATAMVVSGCASYTPQPAAVLAMPNDCANIEAHERWLEAQSSVPRLTLQPELVYEQNRAQFRHRLWTLRYNCRSVK